LKVPGQQLQSTVTGLHHRPLTGRADADEVV
jgi:hypothetical protein